MKTSRLFSLALFLLLCPVLTLAGEPTVIGQVKKAAGEAFLVRGGERLPARVGDPLHEGDALETGADGRLGVTLADNTMLSVGPETHMTLDEYRFDSDALQGNLLADMQRGTLSVVSGDLTKASPDALKVRTPRAILGVRGTEILVEVREEGNASKKKGTDR